MATIGFVSVVLAFGATLRWLYVSVGDGRDWFASISCGYIAAGVRNVRYHTGFSQAISQATAVPEGFEVGSVYRDAAEYRLHWGWRGGLYTWIPSADFNGPRLVCSVPLWVLGLISGIPALRMWRTDFKSRRTGHCATCGYNLTGNLSGRCSECGTELECGV